MRGLIFSLLLVCGVVVAAQRGGPPGQARQQQPDLPKATLRGHVYSQETGQPLKRAELTLRPERGRGSEIVSALTDAQGGFEFRNVESGTYNLRCSRSGYVNISYGQKDPRAAPPSLTVNPGQELKDLDFHLTRAGVISGTVIDEDGEPMADVEVTALKRQYSNRRVRYESVLSVTTDDRGNYRIFDLSPGRYVVLASYHDEAGGDGSRYAPVYYPGAGSAPDAQRVEVGGGTNVSSIDFRLRAVTTYSLSGRVLDTGTGQVVNSGRVSLTVYGGSGQRGGSSMIRPDGAFAMRGLFPGRYIMTIATQGAPPAGVISGVASDGSGRRFDNRPMMRVFDMPAADVKDYVAVIERPVSVRGKLIVEGGQFAGRGARISLAPRSDQMISAVGQVSDDLTFEIERCPRRIQRKPCPAGDGR